MTGKSTRARTGDRGPPDAPGSFHTTEQLGPKQALTPNGNLICYDVPIARVGALMYKAGEIPLKPDKYGVIRVTRSAEELFKPEVLGSCNGIAVTDEHPPELEVTPKTWKRYAYGFATNVRRGEGEDKDVLLADLVITDRELIEQVKGGKREVSLGYDADYEQTGDGEGVQTNIIGNHIALVDRGRCGPRCAIGDHDPFNQPKGKRTMTAPIRKRLTTEDAVRTVLRSLTGDDMGLLEDGTDPPNDGGSGKGSEGATHIHIHSGGGEAAPMGAGNTPPNLTTDDPMDGDPNAGGGDVETRIAALEQGMTKIQAMLQQMMGGQQAADEAPDGELEQVDEEGQPVTKDELPEDLNIEGQKTGDDLPVKETFTAQKTGDSAALSTAFQNLLAGVEILVPGMRVPTFDSKATRAKTVDRMCSIRRRALDAYYATDNGQNVVNAVTGKSDLPLDDMDCAAVATVFKGSVTAQRLLNNRASTGDGAGKTGNQHQQVAAYAPPSIADINKANAEFWARQHAAVTG